MSVLSVIGMVVALGAVQVDVVPVGDRAELWFSSTEPQALSGYQLMFSWAPQEHVIEQETLVPCWLCGFGGGGPNADLADGDAGLMAMFMEPVTVDVVPLHVADVGFEDRTKVGLVRFVTGLYETKIIAPGGANVWNGEGTTVVLDPTTWSGRPASMSLPEPGGAALAALGAMAAWGRVRRLRRGTGPQMTQMTQIPDDTKDPAGAA